MEFLGISRILENSYEFLGIPRNSQKTGNSFCKGHLHNWEFLRIPRNSQKTGSSVRKGLIVSLYISPSSVWWSTFMRPSWAEKNLTQQTWPPVIFDHATYFCPVTKVHTRTTRTGTCWQVYREATNLSVQKVIKELQNNSLWKFNWVVWN